MRALVAAVAVAFLALGATSVVTANNIVPATSLEYDSTAVNRLAAFRPAECAGLALVQFFSGGSNNGTANGDLMLGTAGNDSLAGAGGADCIVGGGGTDTLDGGKGGDVCIGTRTSTFKNCSTIVYRP
jgi:Ca2+-binding RTX toxin-like protein